jgi:hypothetical protein
MELFKAASQWSSRPADERFASIQALYNACHAYASNSGEKLVNLETIRTEASGKDVVLVGSRSVPASLTHWSFGQLAARVGAPASYLRNLPATLASQNLNYGLSHLQAASEDEKKVNLLFHANGSLLLRAFTSDKYARIWNYEVAARLLELEKQGWAPAKPTHHWGQDSVGQCIACGGSGQGSDSGKCDKCAGTGKELPALYASDHDMFAFLMRANVTIAQPVKSTIGDSAPLYRGVIVENSEVGASALKLTRFWFNSMCGNHIIWGASKVLEISVRHVGDARERWQGYQYELKRYAEQGAGEDAVIINRAKTRIIADTKEQVLDRLFGIRTLGLSRKTLEAGWDATVPAQDGAANTQWGIVQGLTRHSQSKPYADDRMGIDRAAGRILEIEF